MERYLRVNLLGPGPRLMKKELPGRGLTKVKKHWDRAINMKNATHVEHVASSGEKWNVGSNLVGKPEGEKPFGRRIDGRIILKWALTTGWEGVYTERTALKIGKSGEILSTRFGSRKPVLELAGRTADTDRLRWLKRRHFALLFRTHPAPKTAYTDKNCVAFLRLSSSMPVQHLRWRHGRFLSLIFQLIVQY